jgi:glycine betaine/proline transport system substrate-binding protein
VGEIAKKRLGCLVNYVYVDEQISWQGFASGQVDVVLENWGHPELIDLYVKKMHVAETAGSIGIKGVIGWFVPPWMPKKYPDITNWKNLNKYASLFRTSESGGKGQFLDGDPGFVTNDEALVKNLHLNFKVVFAGSEAALIEAFRTAQEKKKPMIGYFYSPQWFLSEVPLVQVQLPKYTSKCPTAPAKIRCAYPAYNLDKIVSKKFARSNSTGYQLVRNFKWTAIQQDVVAKYITADGMSATAAADKWIAAHRKEDNSWLPKH